MHLRATWVRRASAVRHVTRSGKPTHDASRTGACTVREATPDCTECGGRGVYVVQQRHEAFDRMADVIVRCDVCERFETDVEAATYVMRLFVGADEHGRTPEEFDRAG
jgi:hypothetical protein